MTKAEVLEAARRGEGCLGRCADDEPVFVLCARDRIATASVLKWILDAVDAGVNEEKVFDALRGAAAMSTWRKLHLNGKLPD